MNLISSLIVLACLVSVQSLAETVNITGEYTREQVHGDNQDCIICHMSHDMKEMILLKRPVSDLCVDCHPDRKTPVEHVVDVIPSMVVEGFPLTEGKMTCVTCHDSHKNTYKKMLRINPKDLCQGCHRH